MDYILVLRVRDNKSKTLLGGKVYKARRWGLNNYKVIDENGNWKPAKRENFLEILVHE